MSFQVGKQKRVRSLSQEQALLECLFAIMLCKELAKKNTSWVAARPTPVCRKACEWDACFRTVGSKFRSISLVMPNLILLVTSTGTSAIVHSSRRHCYYHSAGSRNTPTYNRPRRFTLFTLATLDALIEKCFCAHFSSAAMLVLLPPSSWLLSFQTDMSTQSHMILLIFLIRRLFGQFTSARILQQCSFQEALAILL